MKKSSLIFILVIIAIAIISLFFLFQKNEIKDTNEINKIVTESNLDILLNLENFNETDHSYEKLLQVAMLLASEKGYMNESNTAHYLEYVTKADVHEIIYELTGVNIEAPIQIEDFYYQYDSENEYYYLLPTTPVLHEISTINHVYCNDNIYTIESTSAKSQDGEIVSKNSITTKLKLIETNSYIKYQVIEQKVNQL